MNKSGPFEQILYNYITETNKLLTEEKKGSHQLFYGAFHSFRGVTDRQTDRIIVSVTVHTCELLWCPDRTSSLSV